MARRLFEEPPAVHHRAAFGVLGPEHQPPDTRVADGPGAHGAGLKRDKQGQPRQAIVAQHLRRGAQGENLRMGRGIAGADRRIGGAGHDSACGRVNDHSAHRNLAAGRRRLRLGQGEAHVPLIMVHAHNRNGPGAPGQDAAPVAGERVAKRLARAGVASRREIERLIEAGRVALNGHVLTSPAINVTVGDILTVDGAVVEAAEPTRLFRYHKPAGLVTTHKDPKGRTTVFEALPRGLPRVISVGRLDLMSEGLLLLTNDGGLSRALELPSSGWVRRYRARARGRIEQSRLDALKDGITVEGVRYGSIEATLDKAKEGPTGANLWITLTLAEGKNREVRRVLEALGLTVNRLIRVAYGPFALGVLEPGAVEEVGPRVIREQLAGIVAPANMPTGERAVFKAVAAPSAERRPAMRRADPAPEAKSPVTYKTGWAKPRKRIGPANPGAKAPRRSGRKSGREGTKRPPP